MLGQVLRDVEPYIHPGRSARAARTSKFTDLLFLTRQKTNLVGLSRQFQKRLSQCAFRAKDLAAGRAVKAADGGGYENLFHSGIDLAWHLCYRCSRAASIQHGAAPEIPEMISPGWFLPRRLSTAQSAASRFRARASVSRARRSDWLQQSEASKCLLDRRDLFWRAWILHRRASGFDEAKQLFAVQKPRALGHKAVLARNPFLDFLIRGPLTDWLLLVGVVVRRAPVSSIVLANAHSMIRRVDKHSALELPPSDYAAADRTEPALLLLPQLAVVLSYEGLDLICHREQFFPFSL